VNSASVEQLVGWAADGDHRAWDQLVSRFSSLIQATARRRGLSHTDASDVVQITWMRLFDNLHRIEDPSRLPGWLATTAGREAAALARRANRYVLVDDPAEYQADMWSGPEPGERLLTQERDAVIEEALQQLSPRDRILLTRLMGEVPVTYEELGRELAMPLGSIGPTRARCLQRLRGLIDLDTEVA
jgi:RNA polymerase sigma factor (sigma-70 family)